MDKIRKAYWIKRIKAEIKQEGGPVWYDRALIRSLGDPFKICEVDLNNMALVDIKSPVATNPKD